mgnify:CR=1 FL=1
MGLFSSKKVVTVASSVYNLAGDITKRPNYLKTSLLGSILSETDDSDLSSTLRMSYLQGPGTRLKNFTNWADNNGYNDEIGIIKGNLYTGNSINQTVLAQNIPVNDNQSVELQNVYISRADYTTFVEQYILSNYTNKYNTNWLASLDDLTNIVTITWEDGSTNTFNLSNYDKTSRYLYAYYNTTKDKDNSSVTTGNTVTLGPKDSFPSTDNWALVSNTNTSATTKLTKTTKVDISYSNNTPSTSTTTTEDRNYTYNNNETIYTKTEYQGQSQLLGLIRLTNKIYTEYRDTIGSVSNNDPVVIMIQ